ncbi:MAG: PEP-CTERM sorting domain-containing protein [Puniceicoccales bacterium]
MKNLKLLVLGSILTVTLAQAAITVSVTGNPALYSSGDQDGYVGSTWVFSFTTDATTYDALLGSPAIFVDSANLVITNATDPTKNGEFTITSSDTPEFMVSPSFFGLMYPGASDDYSGMIFTIGESGPTVSGLTLNGPVFFTPAPVPGDTILPEHFNGAPLSESGFMIGTTNYTFTNGSVSSPVPEPSTYAAILGVLCVVGLLARKRPR